MATLDKTWLRPSIIILSEHKPVTTDNGVNWSFNEGSDPGELLYLTDDNRSALQVSPLRIESKRRMVDGTLRSVFVADKNAFSTSWTNIPSRARDNWDGATREYISEYERRKSTVSALYGAGQDIKSWYERYHSDFWIMLVYDADDSDLATKSVQVHNVFFDTFDFTIVKRGPHHDLWDVSIGLVEV
jgi:hypothetical protein